MFEIAHNRIDEMDSLIKRAAERVLNTAVAVSAKMTQGQVNYVYKIEAGGRKFIVKAFKRGWPEEGKLSWIERQLTQYEVEDLSHRSLPVFRRRLLYCRHRGVQEDARRGTRQNRQDGYRARERDRSFDHRR